jgi:hypothetical protein
MVERKAYKRRELCEENAFYQVRYFTARAGAPKKQLFHFAPSPTRAQAFEKWGERFYLSSIERDSTFVPNDVTSGTFRSLILSPNSIVPVFELTIAFPLPTIISSLEANHIYRKHANIITYVTAGPTIHEIFASILWIENGLFKD